MYVKPIEMRETQEYCSEAREPPLEITLGLSAEKPSIYRGKPVKPSTSIREPAKSSISSRRSGTREPIKSSIGINKPEESLFNRNKSEESYLDKVKPPEKCSMVNSKAKKRAAEVRKSKKNQVKGPTQSSNGFKKIKAPASSKTRQPEQVKEETQKRPGRPVKKPERPVKKPPKMPEKPAKEPEKPAKKPGKPAKKSEKKTEPNERSNPKVGDPEYELVGREFGGVLILPKGTKQGA